MRIGILPGLNPAGGGVYQYSLTLLTALYSLQQTGLEDDFVVFHLGEIPPAMHSELPHHWQRLPINGPTVDRKPERFDHLRRFIGEGPHRETWRRVRDHFQPGWRSVPPTVDAVPDPDVVSFRPHITRWLRECQVELMLYPAPRPLSFESGIPCVMAVHDLQHRFQPEFPEISANGEWERREYLFRNAARYATLLLADSEVGKEDILNCYSDYGITEDRVKVLPFLPANECQTTLSKSDRQKILSTLNIQSPYLFYPAQFWPHKNHVRIVQALGQLKAEQHLDIHVVFVGSHEGELREETYRQITDLAQKLGISSQISYLGYVPAEVMAALYADATALIMPTFFGPTNIPPLEAWSHGCPVITSDIRGIREQMADAAILVDPKSVESIADGIAKVWTDETLRHELSTRGMVRLTQYRRSDFNARLISILNEAKEKIRPVQ